jgi:hypothetical protein
VDLAQALLSREMLTRILPAEEAKCAPVVNVAVVTFVSEEDIV